MRALLPFLMLGCYDPPPFNTIDELPIEATDRCDSPRESQEVACVLDGDTLDIGLCGEELGERIRLLGINAPEIAHAPDPAECWGDEAATALRQELAGERVLLTFDVDDCKDTYERTLAWVWLDDPNDPGEQVLINEWLVRQGHARVFEDFIDGVLYEQELRDAEAAAMAEQRGLWASCTGTR
ncbi:MAG: thermonuclease family protein [Proteobacteria bacterium]|nr:thermonuclease family protein [Pseudomonadota bacterium]